MARLERMTFRYACGDEGSTLVTEAEQSRVYDQLETEFCPACKRAARQDGVDVAEWVAANQASY
mgnify:CR=1 FL=1